MKQQNNDFKGHELPVTSITSGIGQAVLPDLLCLPVQIVNVCMVGNPTETNEFILIDAGMPGSVEMIIEAAEERFGAGCKPKAIILTHGHFDHVGALAPLLNKWDVPVYAHELELPFLTGKQNYPEPDPTVDGGLVSEMSPIFPNEAIDLEDQVQPLPVDGTVPSLPGWNAIHTPGHTPGHISLFRNEDRALMAGDAFVTVKQESLYKVMTQKQEISGPPKYLTIDWESSKQSVIKLQQLNPSVAITGHGLPMVGEELTKSLDLLVRDFDTMAVPKHGRYVH